MGGEYRGKYQGGITCVAGSYTEKLGSAGREARQSDINKCKLAVSWSSHTQDATQETGRHG